MPDRNSTWRIGILFSRSGVASVTGTEHFFGTALAIEEINAKGGVLGRQIEPVAYDPGGRPELYSSYARKLLREDEINVIFGCSMSGSRKAVLPFIERYNGLLWYPSIYEGFEFSENVLYTGSTLNQITFALADFILQRYGKRIFFAGSDYIYPRESNRVMRDLIECKGGEVAGEHYVPLDADDATLRKLMREIEKADADAVFSTVIGRGARTLYGLYADAGIDRGRHPIASLTLAEGEIRVIGPDRCTGHVLAAPYLAAVESDENRRFVRALKARFGEEAMATMWSQTAYSQIHLFARALEQTGTLDTQKLSQAALGVDYLSPEGRMCFDPENRHVWSTPRIGVARADGQFEIAWQSKVQIRPDPYLASIRLEEPWLQN
ncbi:MAG: transporter substrate-binding domain-containing protein [Parvibaculaceae bacterium]